MKLYPERKSARSIKRIPPFTELRRPFLLTSVYAFFAAPLSTQAMQAAPLQSEQNSTLLPNSFFWQDHLGLGVLLIIIFLAQALTIAALWVSRCRERQSQQTRRHLIEKETILRNVLVGIAHVKDLHIVSHNRRCEEMFGYEADELDGASIEKIINSREVFDDVSGRAIASFANRKNFSAEVKFRCKDGTSFWGEVTGCSIDPEHPGDGSIWICTDISARRALEESSRELLQVVEQSPVSIVIANLDGDIEYVNPRFTQVTGYTQDDVLGQNPRILQSGETPDETYRELWQTILARRVWRGILRNKRKSGELFWEEASISPILDDKGTITHFVAIKEDITERKRIELQLEHQQLHLEDLVQQRTAELTAALEAAKRADKTKDEFLSNVSHELRTPLNVVIGLSNLAREMSKNPRQRDYLDKIADAGKHLSGIINDLLDLSKIVAGRLEFEMTTFSLRALVQRSHSAMAHKAAEKGLQLVEFIDEQVPDALLGDPLRLQQILLNLLSNAVKFTQEGRIEVRIGLAAREEERICLNIEVEDSGVGMLERDIEQLFKPFSQADASMTRKYGGTGLGLAICRRLAELMDGDITVVSRIGHGTTFKVKVWLGMGKSTDNCLAIEQEAVLTHYRNTHVLVVEDQPLNREIVVQMLLAVGIVPRTASNGREALNILAETGPAKFDLILMDIQMPEMDGLTATREIRALPGFGEVPIIAMTAHAMDHEKQIGILAGMNDHIGKPFETEGFYRIFAKWIAKTKIHELPVVLPPQPSNDALPALKGIDTLAGLSRFGGNTARYRHWLITFLNEASGYATRIRSAIDNGQQNEARKIAHAINGRVSMLGMNDLNVIATALETALQRGEPAEELLESMRLAVREMCNELQSAFGTANPQQDNPGPNNRSQEH